MTYIGINDAIYEKFPAAAPWLGQHGNFIFNHRSKTWFVHAKCPIGLLSNIAVKVVLQNGPTEATFVLSEFSADYTKQQYIAAPVVSWKDSDTFRIVRELTTTQLFLITDVMHFF